MVKNTMPAPGRGIPSYFVDPVPTDNNYYRVSAGGDVAKWIENSDQKLWRLKYKPYDAAWRTDYYLASELVTMLQLKWAE